MYKQFVEPILGRIKLPFEDESINIVTAFETIYFQKNIEVPFREILRVLVKNGQFLICNEGAYSIFSQKIIKNLRIMKNKL